LGLIAEQQIEVFMKKYNKKTILITGINGYIGRNLADYLVNQLGCKNVYGIDKLQIKVVKNSPVTVKYAEIENFSDINKMVGEIRPQIIFHLAANIKPSRELCDLEEMLQTNIIGTINILSAVINNNINLDSFINMGTCEEYGFSEQPFKENQIPDPVSIYSGTKAASAALCRMFYNLYGVPVVTARPSLVYGPGQDERFFIIQAIKSLLINKDFDMTKGEQTRDFIFISDLVSALVELSKTPELAGEAVNVSSGKEYSLKDIVLSILDITKSKSIINFGTIPYRQSEIMRYACDNTKIGSATGWEPSVSLSDGLEEILRHIKLKRS
jgi:UDP-glucose 4-epimerase